ncbi:hypothetical protein HanIR_Chr14g0722981 [Helianthus annuus]|nr:hypothetical protein HanIR_Chr14g0722981 [Helianthus annuus]
MCKSGPTLFCSCIFYSVLLLLFLATKMVQSCNRYDSFICCIFVNIVINEEPKTLNRSHEVSGSCLRRLDALKSILVVVCVL